MHISPLLGPVVALVIWSIVMLVWMAIKRGPLVGNSREIPPGSRGVDLEARHPGTAHWPAHNYQHLMEQPTIFYAIIFALVLMGFDAWINVYLAWAYVGLRIVHSIVQSTFNVVRIRFLIFLLASISLACLAIHAAIFLIHHA
ncbi:MAPEG family protein [Sphingomonas agri]|uniref:MAPEG family protein n=1 Tax=Sphingomonas agri TaxID=1813878 RepID=UPI00311EB19D